ncbi:MAG: recombinase A [Nannocystis sp.]|nr:recombinase A [Nannocystis sp.]
MALGQLAEPGRLIEISGVGASARHTTAVALVRQAQLEGETTVWVQPAGGPLYPPDLAESGVDLAALVVVHVPEDRGQVGLARAAELLLRSGAYGLCVVDLSGPEAACPAGHVASDMAIKTVRPPRLKGSAWQARLAALARMHHSRVVVLTRAAVDRASLGPMVGLRIDPRRERRASGLFAVRPEVLKHKGAPLLAAPTLRRGPWGLS